MTDQLVLASHNAAKLVELRRILAAAGVPVVLSGLDEFPGAPEVTETGLTFAENALLKARAIAAFTGFPRGLRGLGPVVGGAERLARLLPGPLGRPPRRRRRQPGPGPGPGLRH